MALTAESNLENPNKVTGLTASDVESTIAKNVQWQYIETLTMNNYNEVIFNNPKIKNYDMIKIVWEGINLVTQTAVNCKLYINDQEISTSAYGYALHQQSQTSRSSAGTAGSLWPLIHTYTPENGLSGEFEFVTAPDSYKSIRWSIGGQQGTTIGIKIQGYGTFNNAVDRVSGYKFYTSGNNLGSGKMHMYGRNNHA